MKRCTRLPWSSRVAIALLAAAPALACVSGAADPFDAQSGAPIEQAGTTSGGSGSLPNGGGATLLGGSASSAGTSSSVAGTSSLGGTSTVSGGTTGAGGVAQGGSAGAQNVEKCDFPAWIAGKAYVAGDKVLYMNQAFVATNDNPGYDPLISTYFWSPYSCEAVGTGGSSSGGDGSGGSGMVVNSGDCVLDQLLPAGETSFHAMFIPPWQGHQEKPLYSYSALCTALKGFGQFANSGNVENDKREVAAFFAHVAKETAFLEQTDEAGQPSNAGDYHGRGAIQLTGQANYQAAGDYLQKNLVANPGLVSTDAVVNWQTALWFWTVHNNPGTAGVQNCHQAIQAGDFAQTTRIINGGIECPGSQSAQARAQYYQSNCSLLSVSAGGNLVC